MGITMPFAPSPRKITIDSWDVQPFPVMGGFLLLYLHGDSPADLDRGMIFGETRLVQTYWLTKMDD